MRELLTGRGAKAVDTYCIQQMGIPSVVLMERAALGVAEEVMRVIDPLMAASVLNVTGEQPVRDNRPKTGAGIAVICGVGNNGADGLAAARILREKGYHCRVLVIGEPKKATQEFLLQFQIINRLGINCSVCQSEEEIRAVSFEKEEWVIDALFGIGLSREVTGIFRQMIGKMNDSHCKIIAVDIASGIDADTGKVMGAAVRADRTVTFGKAKTGHFLCDGKDYSGKVIEKDAGFVKEAYENVIKEMPTEIFACHTKESLKLIPPRKKTSHKGTYHTVKVVGAGENMSGAVILSGTAAYACGAGLVKIYAGRNHLDVIKTCVREAVVDDHQAFFEQPLSEEKDILVAGPGLGTGTDAERVVEKVLQFMGKIVLDADALNIISRNRLSNKSLTEIFHQDVIITPHIGEMSRLTGLDAGWIRENIVSCARDFSRRHGCVTVLKDAATVISDADGRVMINISGNSGMSKGGSGDVLTGVIGGLLSQGLKAFEAATLGVYLHGLSGDLAAEKKGEYSMMAGDIVEGIAEVLLSCRET